MKKFINDVENVENEMLEGIVLAHPEYCLLYTSPSPRD